MKVEGTYIKIRGMSGGEYFIWGRGIFYMVIGEIQIYKFNTFFNTGVMDQG
jgi:hypothetical protein